MPAAAGQPLRLPGPSRSSTGGFDAEALNHRIKLAIGSQSLRAIARLTGVSVETARRYMNGAMPSSDFLARLCDKLGLNAEWLLTGDGPMLLDGIHADALRHATVEQIIGEIARKFETVADRVARLEVAVFAASRPTGGTSPAR